MSIKALFQKASIKAPTAPKPKKKTKPAPFSLRLNIEERAFLEERAGAMPLGAYIRQELLGDRALKRRAARKPTLSDEHYAALLAALGQSRLSSNLNQLAHHANMGTLDTSPEVERQLQDAYAAVLAMRKALLTALNLRSGGGQ